MDTNYFKSSNNQYGLAISCGLVDGIFINIEMLIEMSKGIKSKAKKKLDWWDDALNRLTKKSMGENFADGVAWLDGKVENIKKHVKVFADFLADPTKFTDKIRNMLDAVYTGVKKWFKSFNPLDNQFGYTVGKLCFDVILSFLTSGVLTGLKYSQAFTRLTNAMSKFEGNKIASAIVDFLKKAETDGIKNAFKCKILGKGCFVKDTPVLVDRNAISKSGKAYALAAGLPFMALPIQEVPLLSWTVANETVSEQNNLIASTDEDLYMGLLDGDPYTSPQQKQRDKYELNDTDWYSVSFEQVDGTSKCHFALHDDWIQQQGYVSDKVVILNLPEQGINGPFRVTAIKHIIPQKKPSDDAGDGYDWKPVTALFEHQSNQVYTIDFDNGEQLGVTYQHPIFSTTANDWKLAGELEVGEKVLTYKGEAAVTASQIKDGSETVYNLEVKELHNFLVSNSGVVVHNLCYDLIKKRFKLNTKPGKKIKGYHPEPGTTRKLKKQDENSLQQKADKDGRTLKRDDDGDLVICYDDFGFPDFTDYIPKIDGLNGKFDGIFNIGSMTGDKSDFTSALEMMKAQLPSNSPLQNLTKNDVPFDIDGVKYTFHHHQDCKTMMLVPSSVNGVSLGGAPHVGGSSMSQALPQEDIDLFKKELDPSKTSKYKSKCN